MGELSILGTKGDTKLIWNPENEDETEAAANQFNELTEKGFLAFEVKVGGRKGEKIEKFDPDAGKIIMTPAIKGG